MIREPAVRAGASVPTFRVTRSRVAREISGPGSAGHDFGTVRVLDQSEPEPGGPAPTPQPTPAPATPEPMGGGTPVVTIPPVRPANASAGTPDRIPPRIRTPVSIGISGLEPAMAPVTVSVEGASPDNGEPTIDGKASVDLTESTDVRLSAGEKQQSTKPRGLRLVAKQGTTQLARGAPFSVAAYPLELGFKYYSKMVAETIPDDPTKSLYWGAKYDLTASPDSRSAQADVRQDLDGTTITERVVVDSATGIFKGAGLGRSGFKPTTKTQRDHHGAGDKSAAALIASIDKVGADASTTVSHQFYRFACTRSGVPEDRDKGPKVPKSGFKITKWTSKADSKYYVHVTKEGFANNGVDAGPVDDPTEKKAEIRD